MSSLHEDTEPLAFDEGLEGWLADCAGNREASKGADDGDVTLPVDTALSWFAAVLGRLNWPAVSVLLVLLMLLALLVRRHSDEPPQEHCALEHRLHLSHPPNP